MQKILIVGGGIGGLSAGIAFRKKGIEVDVVEIQQAYNVYGVGIIQQANALRALDVLGVADEAMRRGSPYGKVKLCAPHGLVIGETGTPPIGRFPSHNGISRKVLHDVLYEGAMSNLVHIRMGVTINALVHKKNAVEVSFSDGSLYEYDLVIGADGINSTVRQLVFDDYKPTYIGSSVWRYPLKRPVDLETGYMFFGKKVKLGLIPMTADTIYMFVVSSEGTDNPFIPHDDLIPKLRSYVQSFPAPMVQGVLDQITDPTEVIYRPLETMMMPLPWYRDRVLIIGDAAHATIPQLGSGAALAVEDAVVIAEEVAEGGSIDDIIHRYMTRRYDRCKTVVDVSNTLAEWEQLEWSGLPLPEGANMGALMGKTLMELTKPI